MTRRTFLNLTSAALIALLSAVPASAGGWAVVTLDRLPAQVVAGQPVEIGFVVRQHGQRPMAGLTPQINMAGASVREFSSVTAKAQGSEGHYAATLTFPSAGTWSWSINAFGFDQPMPALAVHTSALSPANRPMVSLKMPAHTRASGLPAYVAQALRQFALALHQTQPAAPRSAQEIGRDLFLAKGCVVCHWHDAVREARKDLGGFSVGPDLTDRKLDPDYLRTWLKDPKAVKPATEMPNLELKQDEIEALIAFLTAD